jgi:hypothetical protein
MINLRKYRIFDLAIFDYVATFVVVIILHAYMWINTKVNYKRTTIQYFISLIVVFIGMLGLKTIIHYFFGVKSTFLIISD